VKGPFVNWVKGPFRKLGERSFGITKLVNCPKIKLFAMQKSAVVIFCHFDQDPFELDRITSQMNWMVSLLGRNPWL
jgi:hypothetical protein